MNLPRSIEVFNNKCFETQKELKNLLNKDKPLNANDLTGELEDSELFDNSFIVKCHYPNCGFRGPLILLDNHVRIIHDNKLDEMDDEAFIAERKKHFPFQSKKKLSNENQVLTQKIKTENKLEDPMSVYPKKKERMSPNKDILGLGALYDSDSENDTEVEKKSRDPFYGLPEFQDILRLHRFRRRTNKFGVPISATMDLHGKRNSMMNVKYRYTSGRKFMRKRPRIMDLMFAEEISSDSNQTMQVLRYILNNNFFDSESTEVVYENAKSEITGNITEQSVYDEHSQSDNDLKTDLIDENKELNLNCSAQVVKDEVSEPCVNNQESIIDLENNSKYLVDNTMLNTNNIKNYNQVEQQITNVHINRRKKKKNKPNSNKNMVRYNNNQSTVMNLKTEKTFNPNYHDIAINSSVNQPVNTNRFQPDFSVSMEQNHINQNNSFLSKQKKTDDILPKFGQKNPQNIEKISHSVQSNEIVDTARRKQKSKGKKRKLSPVKFTYQNEDLEEGEIADSD